MDSVLLQFNKEHSLIANKASLAALVYHDIFGYPLTKAELIKWTAGKKIEELGMGRIVVNYQKGFYYLNGKHELVLKRLMSRKIARKKIKIAKVAAQTLSRIPTIKMVGLTGSLAMKNPNEDSDIDLMVITKRDTLWTTRALSYFLIKLSGLSVRKPGDKKESNRLCLNIWLDESDLAWEEKKRNIYTAHEIAQVKSLVNKDKSYERFLWTNRWIADYWPKSAKIQKPPAGKVSSKSKTQDKSNLILRISNLLTFWAQYLYMRSKMTREIITPTRALFHPIDWGGHVLKLLYGKNS